MISLKNLVLLEGGHAFALAPGQTKLSANDYRFLERFLDVTKANLFFAHGVLIVEGDAEAILLPTLARLLGTDLTEHGVSIVNVGGTGLRRFSRIFQRHDESASGLPVPVACLADMDVMPDCAPVILGLVTSDDDEKWKSPRRRWQATRDFGDEEKTPGQALDEWRARGRANDGQSVRTFVADHWTLEYDLAFCGLAEEVYVAANLAKNDAAINEEKKKPTEVEAAARTDFNAMEEAAAGDRAALCSRIYKLFHSGERLPGCGWRQERRHPTRLDSLRQGPDPPGNDGAQYLPVRPLVEEDAAVVVGQEDECERCWEPRL